MVKMTRKLTVVDQLLLKNWKLGRLKEFAKLLELDHCYGINMDKVNPYIVNYYLKESYKDAVSKMDPPFLRTDTQKLAYHLLLITRLRSDMYPFEELENSGNEQSSQYLFPAPLITHARYKFLWRMNILSYHVAYTLQEGLFFFKINCCKRDIAPFNSLIAYNMDANVPDSFRQYNVRKHVFIGVMDEDQEREVLLDLKGGSINSIF